MSLKKLYFSIVDIYRGMLRFFGVSLKPAVLIDCIETFHYLHIGAVVDILVQDSKVKVFLLENKNFNRQLISDALVDKSLFITPIQAKFIKFDMTISLEYIGGAWVPHKGIQIFSPHGDGMKISYAADKRLSKFDVVWALGETQQSVQKSCLRDDAIIEKIGFIATDQLKKKYQLLNKQDRIVIENDLPTILYAPSWSDSSEMILISENILEQLATQTDFNVVIKPHPYLLRPEKCDGKDWEKIIKNFRHERFWFVHNPHDFIYRYMVISDLLVSDISSVIFEYLFLDNPIVVQVNEKVLEYYKGGEKFNQISEVAHLFFKEEDLMPAIIKSVKNPLALSSKRKGVLNGLYYNIGKAGEAGVESVYKLFSI